MPPGTSPPCVLWPLEFSAVTVSALPLSLSGRDPLFASPAFSLSDRTFFFTLVHFSLFFSPPLVVCCFFARFSGPWIFFFRPCPAPWPGRPLFFMWSPFSGVSTRLSDSSLSCVVKFPRQVSAPHFLSVPPPDVVSPPPNFGDPKCGDGGFPFLLPFVFLSCFFEPLGSRSCSQVFTTPAYLPGTLPIQPQVLTFPSFLESSFAFFFYRA